MRQAERKEKQEKDKDEGRVLTWIRKQPRIALPVLFRERLHDTVNLLRFSGESNVHEQSTKRHVEWGTGKGETGHVRAKSGGMEVVATVPQRRYKSEIWNQRTHTTESKS